MGGEHLLEAVWDLHPNPAEDSSVKETAKLPKAIERQNQCSCKQASQELPSHVNKGCVPEAIEDQGWAQHSGRVQSRTSIGSSCKPKTCLVLQLEEVLEAFKEAWK